MNLHKAFIFGTCILLTLSSTGFLNAQSISLGPEGAATGLPRGWLDFPKADQGLSGNVTVSGWGISVAGRDGSLLNSISLFVDGVFAMPLLNRVGRPDVQAYIEGLGISAPADCGFTGVWDSRSIADGPHVLSIRGSDIAAASPDAMLDLQSVSIRTNNAAGIRLFGSLDAPGTKKDNQLLIMFRGWTRRHVGWEPVGDA